MPNISISLEWFIYIYSVTSILWRLFCFLCSIENFFLFNYFHVLFYNLFASWWWKKQYKRRQVYMRLRRYRSGCSTILLFILSLHSYWMESVEISIDQHLYSFKKISYFSKISSTLWSRILRKNKIENGKKNIKDGIWKAINCH